MTIDDNLRISAGQFISIDKVCVLGTFNNEHFLLLLGNKVDIVHLCKDCQREGQQ